MHSNQGDPLLQNFVVAFLLFERHVAQNVHFAHQFGPLGLGVVELGAHAVDAELLVRFVLLDDHQLGAVGDGVGEDVGIRQAFGGNVERSDRRRRWSG